jgi:hypothetical protein
MFDDKEHLTNEFKLQSIKCYYKKHKQIEAR